MAVLNVALLAVQQNNGGGWSFFVMMGLIFVIMWFFMIRPQQKKQKEIQKFRNAIGVGTEVVTAGGIYGTVRGIKDEKNALEIEVANGVKIVVDRNSVYATVPTDGR